MNTFVRLLPVICACVVTQAFATDPPSNPSEQERPPSAAAGAATASQSSPAPTKPDSDAVATTERSSVTQSASVKAATGPSKPARIVLDDKTLTNEEVRQLFAQGYKPVGRGGEVYYCRREQQTGSRFTTMSCKTADQMKQLTRDSKDMLSAKQKSGGCMSSGAGC